MFSYLSVVFGLKQDQQFHKEFSELLSCRNIIIYQHNTDNDRSCGWPGVHFHGLFEYCTSIGYQDDRILNQMKMCCTYFTTQEKNPLNYFLLVRKYGMEFITIECRKPSNLYEHIKACYFVQHGSITNQINEENITRPCGRLSKNNYSILDLCRLFCINIAEVNKCLSPRDSATFVHKWCISQNISTGDFVNNWIYCLDSEIQHKNTLYFQGVNNSCFKVILNSIIDVCEPFVEKISNGTTGYKFFWKSCLGKRMIVLYDPHFDRLHSQEKLLEILEGTESSIPVGDNTCVTMQQTPVIIIGQEYPSDRKIQFEIKNRLIKGYNNLKSFQPPQKKLHPMWLCELADKYYAPRRYESNILPSKDLNEEPTENDINQPQTPLAIFAIDTELPRPDILLREQEVNENASDCSEPSETYSESYFIYTEEKTEDSKRKSDLQPLGNNDPGTSDNNIGKKKQTKENKAGGPKNGNGSQMSGMFEYASEIQSEVNQNKKAKSRRANISPPKIQQGIITPQVSITPILGQTAANVFARQGISRTPISITTGLGQTAASVSARQGIIGTPISITPGFGQTAASGSSARQGIIGPPTSITPGLGQIAASVSARQGISRIPISINPSMGQTAASEYAQQGLDSVTSSDQTAHASFSGATSESSGIRGNERGRKRSNDENCSAREKVRKIYVANVQKHPEKKDRVTYKNLLRNKNTK